MNYKRKKPTKPHDTNWSSPTEFQPNREVPETALQDGLIPYKKYPNKKFCKVHKGEHIFRIVDISLHSWFKKQAFIHLQCACGKKDLEFKNAEALSQEEKVLLAVQAAEDERRKAFQSARISPTN